MVVREAANSRNLSGEIELRVAFCETGFSTLAVGDVLNDRKEVVHGAVNLAHAAYGKAGPDDATIFANIALLDAVTIGIADESFLQYREIRFKIVRMGDLLEGLGMEFLGGVTEHTGKAVIRAQQ